MAVFKSIIAFFKTVIVFFMSFTQLMLPGIQKTVNGGESAFFEQWSPEQAYTENYAAELAKETGKDFVVLNLTDIQMGDIESFDAAGDLAFGTIKKLVEETDPDLITLTGDNAWATYAYIKLVKEIDSYGIPWAPVMGNHDGQGCPSEYWCASQFANAKNCLFKFGPEGMGYGNYIINITENGQIIHTLYMMDTHSSADDTEEGAALNGTGYDGFWSSQFKWYEWAVKGNAALAGKNVESTIFVHIPLYEYNNAWNMAYDQEAGAYRDEFAATSFGVNHEGICSPNKNNGFFDLLKELDSTKTVIAGHDHVNCSSIVYEGVRLSYGLKCGSGCYWESEMSGGTTVSINSDGAATVQHIYVDPASVN